MLHFINRFCDSSLFLSEWSLTLSKFSLMESQSLCLNSPQWCCHTLIWWEMRLNIRDCLHVLLILWNFYNIVILQLILNILKTILFSVGPGWYLYHYKTIRLYRIVLYKVNIPKWLMFTRHFDKQKWAQDSPWRTNRLNSHVWSYHQKLN